MTTKNFQINIGTGITNEISIHCSCLILILHAGLQEQNFLQQHKHNTLIILIQLKGDQSWINIKQILGKNDYDN